MLKYPTTLESVSQISRIPLKSLLNIPKCLKTSAKFAHCFSQISHTPKILLKSHHALKRWSKNIAHYSKEPQKRHWPAFRSTFSSKYNEMYIFVNSETNQPPQEVQTLKGNPPQAWKLEISGSPTLIILN